MIQNCNSFYSLKSLKTLFEMKSKENNKDNYIQIHEKRSNSNENRKIINKLIESSPFERLSINKKTFESFEIIANNINSKNTSPNVFINLNDCKSILINCSLDKSLKSKSLAKSVLLEKENLSISLPSISSFSISPDANFIKDIVLPIHKLESKKNIENDLSLVDNQSYHMNSSSNILCDKISEQLKNNVELPDKEFIQKERVKNILINKTNNTINQNNVESIGLFSILSKFCVILTIMILFIVGFIILCTY